MARQTPVAGGGATEAPNPARRATSAQDGPQSALEAILENRIERAGLPMPERQFRFCPTRKWRADFAYRDAMLLIEVDGGVYSGGRHTRGKGFEADCEKLGTAAAMGYRVIRVTRGLIEDGRAVALIAQALEPAGGASAEGE